MVLNGVIKIGGKNYVNGKLPSSVTVPLAYAKNQRLYADAADAWNRVNADFKKKTGKNIDITDSYRPYATQEAIFKDRYRRGYLNGADNRHWGDAWYHRVKGSAAAVPGTSNHGLGRAVDVNLGSQQYFGSTYYDTLKSVAAKHGYNNDVGRTINEPWHWEYEPSRDKGKSSSNQSSWGKLTPTRIKSWQKALGTTQDGKISKPYSSLIAAQQRAINSYNKKYKILSGGPLKVTGVLTNRDRIALVKMLNDMNKRKKFLSGGPLSTTKDLTSGRRNEALAKAIDGGRIKPSY